MFFDCIMSTQPLLKNKSDPSLKSRTIHYFFKTLTNLKMRIPKPTIRANIKIGISIFAIIDHRPLLVI
jgi:hypothetical protein